jgi:hypothetical protein
MITEASEEQIAFERSKEDEYRTGYAVAMLNLQEKAGLTFKEASVHVLETTPIDLAEDWGVNVRSIYNLQRKAKKKIEESGYTSEELCGDYAYERHPPILVDRVRTID